jgi:hypothetical protein
MRTAKSSGSTSLDTITLRPSGLVEEIRRVLKHESFLGEGHKKVTLRLRRKGIRVGKNRVLRLMRENGLLVPVRRCHERGDRTHSGTIRTERPDEPWGTDATMFYTEQDGWCWFFALRAQWPDGPSGPSTTARTRSSDTRWRRRETAGRHWSRSGRG